MFLAMNHLQKKIMGVVCCVNTSREFAFYFKAFNFLSDFPHSQYHVMNDAINVLEMA